MLLTVFSRLLTRLIPLIGLLCAVVPVMGAREPSYDQSWEQFGFAYCDLPCFVGITPGVTSFDQVARLLARHIPVLDPRMIASGSSINFWARMPTEQLAGLMRYDRGLVGEMRFNVVLPVQAVISELGTPDCILPNVYGEPDRLTVIFWERGQVSIGAVLSPAEHTVSLSADTMALWLRVTVPGDCSLRGAQPWRGFAPLWDYRS
jgi:hypothetical protein